MRRAFLPLAFAALLACSGCAAVIDATVDSALETKEERQIRKDRQRARNGEPMKHHDGWEDLNAHQEDIDRRHTED
jgi:hypothetical protein